MKIHEKIRMIRENKHWSQEYMASKLNISANGYSKIERGETRLNLPRLEQIADIFEMDIVELLQSESGWNYHFGDNNSNNYSAIYSVSSAELAMEIEKLRQEIQHKKDIILQKDKLLEQQSNEIETLKELVAILKNK